MGSAAKFYWGKDDARIIDGGREAQNHTGVEVLPWQSIGMVIP